jgi:hypothetical protein
MMMIVPVRKIIPAGSGAGMIGTGGIVEFMLASPQTATFLCPGYVAMTFP